MTRTFDEQLENYGVSAEGRLATCRPGKWIGYAAAGTFGLLAPDAEAAIQNITDLPGTFGYPGSLTVDIDGNAVNDLRFFFTGFDGSIYHSDDPARAQVGAIPSFYDNAATYVSGVDLIGPTGFYAAANANQFAEVAADIGSSIAYDLYGATDSGILGVRFQRSGNPHFAWLRISFTGLGTPGVSVQILEGAWEDQPNTAIVAGAIPEPSTLATSSLALLALGAAGISHYRKKKAELATA